MQSNIVNLSITDLIVGIIEILFFSTCILIMIFFPNGTEALWVYIGFSLFIVSGAVIVLFCIFWRLEYNDEGFIYHNCFGHRTTVLFSSIYRIKRTRNAVYLYANNRRYNIFTNAKGIDGFLDVLSRQSLRLQD